jgi:lysozyme
MRPVPNCAYAFLKQHEGLKLTASADVGGTMDAGYGHTDPTLKTGQTITQRQADLWLKRDVAKAAASVCALVSEPVLLDLTENQYAALISFVFNLGPNPKATIWKLINARDHDHVPAEFMRWVYCKGKKLQGLVNRRAAEVALWSTEEPGSVPDDPSSAVTRNADTPPLPAKKQGIASHVIACGAAACAAIANYSDPIKKGADSLAAFAGAPIIAHVVEILLTIGGIAALAGFVATLLKNRAARA